MKKYVWFRSLYTVYTNFVYITLHNAQPPRSVYFFKCQFQNNVNVCCAHNKINTSTKHLLKLVEYKV